MISYYISIFFGRLISILPFWMLYLFSDFIFFLLNSVIGYRKKVIMDNLSKSFPAKSESELNSIRSKFYKNFADIIVESFKSLTVSEKAMRKRFKLKNPEVFQKLYEQDKGLIMVMGHYTNFEWTAMFMPQLVPQKSFAVYHPLKNERFNSLIVRMRERFGLQLFKMKDTYPFMLENPVKNPLYVFMADQSPHIGKIKYRTPFLNQLTPVHLGVENLAKKCDLAVVFIEVHRLKRGHYEVEAKLLYQDAKDLEQYEITKTHVKELENLINKKPEDWLWSHRRWKYV